MCMPILKDPTPRYRLRYVTDDTITWLLSPLHERTLCFDPKDDHFWSETPTPPRMIPFGDHARYGLDLYALAIEIIIIAACVGAWWLVWRPWHKKKDKDTQDATEKKRPLPLWLYVVSLAILIIGIAFLLTVIIFTARRYIILNS